MGLATLLPIFGFAALFARLLRTTWSVAMLHAVSAIIVTLYLGGLVGVLWWTACAVHLVGASLLCYELYRRSRAGERPEFSAPIAMLVLCIAVFWLIHRNSLYLFYDEFSHWGVYIREMLALDGFWLADTNSMHPRYPPGAPLWQYLFNVFLEPREGIAYLAQFVLLLTPLIVLWERVTWRQPHWLVLVLALGALAVTNFGLGISSLYVDHVIGAWFVGTILCFVTDLPASRRSVMYALPLVVLALLKESSVAFAFAAAGILGTLTWFQLWQRSGLVVRSAVHASCMIAVVAVPALLCLGAWEWRLDQIDAPADIEAVAGVVSGITGKEQVDPDEGAEITRRFLEVFSKHQLSNDGVSRQFNAFSYSIKDLFTDRYRLSTLGLFVLYFVWWIALIAFVLQRAERWTWAIVAAGVALTGIAYVVALYVIYRFAAGEYGLVLSSYTRYVHTVALPMLIVCFAPLLPAFRSGQDRVWQILGRAVPLSSALAIVGCVGLYIFEKPYLRPLLERNAAVELRAELEPITSAIHAAVGRSSVWLYMPNDLPNGFVGHLFQYLMAPTPTHVEREKSFLERTPSEIHSIWSQFEYVWIPTELDAELTNRFVEVSGLPLTERLFLVSTDESGRTRLRPATSQK